MMTNSSSGSDNHNPKTPRYTIIVVDDVNTGFLIPREVAVCADCDADLRVVPNELESVGIDLCMVFMPILDCRNNECHADHMTNEWYDIYNAVDDWFETIL